MLSSVKSRFFTAEWRPRLLVRREAWHKKIEEQEKVIVRDSVAAALRCCLVHVVPILTSTLILFLNLHGLYIGVDFKSLVRSETINLLLLQIAAKAHEILIIASLGQIILQLVRHELLFGHGLPLGLIGSGLAFGNFEFFFNKQFYGALRYLASRDGTRRKIGFLTVLVVSGLVAALAGPVSATLLVPKSQTWPSGGTDFFLNGTYQNFWPDDTGADLAEVYKYCSRENSTSSGICPGGGFLSLWEHWGRLNYTNFYRQDVRPYARKLSGSDFYWPVHSPDSLIPPLYALGDARKSNDVWANTFLVQPHAATATMLQRIGEDWWLALLKNQNLDPILIDDRQIQGSAKTAITSTRCAEPMQVSASETTIQFPTIRGRFDYAENLELKLDSIDQNATDHLRFRWVQLPNQFGPASVGAIFEAPWAKDNRSRIVVGCTVQSGWIPATYLTDEYSFWSGWYPWNLQFGDRTPALIPAAPGETTSPTSGRIAFSDGWLELLTPPAPLMTPMESGWRPSTIETILERVGLSSAFLDFNSLSFAPISSSGRNLSYNDTTPILEAIVSSVIVDGLSRSGCYRLFDTTGPSTQWSLINYQPLVNFDRQILNNQTAVRGPQVFDHDVTWLGVTMSITGFAYHQSLVTYLSMSVLLTHMAMAAVHIVWILSRKHTSRSWGTIAELIALAQNSQPALTLLKNTGSGIQNAKTFSHIARIRVRRDSSARTHDRVELVFENPGGSTDCAEISESDMTITLTTLQRTSSVPIDCSAQTGAAWSLQDNSDLLLHPQDSRSHGRSVSRDRLIQSTATANEEKANVVRVNGWYG